MLRKTFTLGARMNHAPAQWVPMMVCAVLLWAPSGSAWAQQISGPTHARRGATAGDLRRQPQLRPGVPALPRRMVADFSRPPVPRLDTYRDDDRRVTSGKVLGRLFVLSRGIEFSIDLYTHGSRMPNTMWGDANRRIAQSGLPPEVTEPVEFVVWYALSQNGMQQIFHEFMEGMAGNPEMMQRARDDARRGLELIPGGSEVLDAFAVGRFVSNGGPAPGLTGDGTTPLPSSGSEDDDGFSVVPSGGGSPWSGQSSTTRPSTYSSQPRESTRRRTGGANGGGQPGGGSSSTGSAGRERRDSDRSSNRTTATGPTDSPDPPQEAPPSESRETGDGGGGDTPSSGDGPADSGEYDGGEGPFGQGIRFLPQGDNPMAGHSQSNARKGNGGDVGSRNMPTPRSGVTPYRIRVGEHRKKKQTSPDDSERPRMASSSSTTQRQPRNPDDIDDDLPGRINNGPGRQFDGTAKSTLPLEEDFRPMPIP